jgi:protein-S-isoprenylcysteine O-methyltransferase Ste14
MSIELFPSRDPLRRLGSIALITGLLGLLAIVYTMVKFVQDRNSAEEWMFGVGCCLLFGAVATSLVQGVLLSHRARIEALEKRADRPADGTPS